MTVDLWGPEYYLKEGTSVAVRLCRSYSFWCYRESRNFKMYLGEETLDISESYAQFQTILISVHGSMALKYFLKYDRGRELREKLRN